MRSPARLLLLPLAALCASPALAQPLLSGVYEGRVGDFPILMRLDPTDPDEGSKYAYRSRGLDLRLGVKMGAAGAVTLSEFGAYDSSKDAYTVNATFEGTLRGGTLSGTWRSADGKRRLPFTVSKVDAAGAKAALPSSPGLEKLRRSDPYTFLKLNRAFAAAPRSAGLEWRRETLSGVAYPRTGNARLDAALQDRQLDAAAQALDCRSFLAQGPRAGETSEAWEQTTTVTYRSATLFSLKEEIFADCGGAHPNAWTDGAILEVASGRELKPAELWPRLTAARLNTAYQGAYRTSGNTDPECVSALRDLGKDSPEYTAFLSSGGLTLWPAFLPHVVLACAEEITLPFSLLGSGSALAPKK